MKSLIERLRSIVTSGFVRAVAMLVGGAAIAQLIFALSLPVATRLYSPNDFSLLALFAAIVWIVSSAACLRFDIAIPIAAREDEAANLLALAVGSAVLISAIVAVPILVAPDWTARQLNRPDSAPFLWLVPIGILFASLYSATQFWLVRCKEFREIATTRIAQAAAGAAAQIGLGLAAVAPFGLVLGQTLNFGAGSIWLAWRFLRGDPRLLTSVRPSAMRRAFAANSRFPRYSALEALFNSASIYLPVVLISSLAASPEAGFVILAMQVMQAPMSILGSAIAQVYLSRAPNEFRAGTLGRFTTSIFGGLLRSGVGPLVFAGIVAPEAFAIVFGKEWQPAGAVVTWMTPWFVTQFLSSPISMALHVSGNQKIALVLQMIGLAVRVGAVWITYLIAPGFLTEAYSLSGFVFYSIYLGVVLHCSGTNRGEVIIELRKSLPTIGLFVAIGLAFTFVVTALI